MTGIQPQRIRCTLLNQQGTVSSQAGRCQHDPIIFSTAVTEHKARIILSDITADPHRTGQTFAHRMNFIPGALYRRAAVKQVHVTGKLKALFFQHMQRRCRRLIGFADHLPRLFRQQVDIDGVFRHQIRDKLGAF